MRPRGNTGGTQEPIGCDYPNTGSTDLLLFPKLMVLNLGAGRVSNKAGPVMLRSGLRYKEPTPTKVNALVGVSPSNVMG